MSISVRCQVPRYPVSQSIPYFRTLPLQGRIWIAMSQRQIVDWCAICVKERRWVFRGHAAQSIEPHTCQGFRLSNVTAANVSLLAGNLPVGNQFHVGYASIYIYLTAV